MLSKQREEQTENSGEQYIFKEHKGRRNNEDGSQSQRYEEGLVAAKVRELNRVAHQVDWSITKQLKRV